MKLQFPPTFDFVKQDIDTLGYWEKRTTEYIKSHLKKGQTFLDVGAQVGYFTVLACELGAKVIAFEPSKANREYLHKNLVENKCTSVSIFNQALSNFHGESYLYKGKTPGENTLEKDTWHTDGQEKETVKIAKFDELNLGVPDMIKMDIEGHEMKALQGMQSVLKTTKPITIILESWDNKVADWLVDKYKFNLVTTDRMSGNRILTKNQPFTYEEEPIRCHLLGTFNAPNTLKDEGIGNAFGTKVINMAKILKKLGHYVIFYGVEGSEVECDEFVPVSTMAILKQTYGEWDKMTIYKEQYGDYSHKVFNENCIREINKRKRVGDFLLLCHGTFHQEIATAVNIPDTIEMGVGHASSFAKFRIFESETWRAWTYGREDNDLNPNPIPGSRIKNLGNFYDCVIPGFFDPKDFIYSEKKDDYLLYLGRIMKNKGIYVAQQICEKLGIKLKVAGFYYKVDEKFFKEFIAMPNVEYVGFAGKEKRQELMTHAKTLLLPTLYLEPFGYVVLEANLSGTPVITTDFGAFSETVKQGITGFRCRTFKEFLEAVKNVEKIKPQDCREWGMQFTIDKIAPMYKRYFTQILSLTGKGWYSLQ